jgi:hypothetical protein
MINTRTLALVVLFALTIPLLFAASFDQPTAVRAAGETFVAPGNLLTNSDFEAGSTTGWYSFGAAPGVVSAGASHAGAAGLLLGPGEQGLGQNVTLLPNSIYALSAWGRNSSNDYAQVTVRVTDGAGVAIDYQMAFSGNEWLRQARTIQTPPTISSVVVYALKNAGSGSFAVDDISLAAGRDVQAWPFETASIWNTPLGSAAQYAPVDLVIEPSVILDESDMPYGSSTMPRREGFTAGSINGAPDFGMCNQDPTLGSVGEFQGTLQVPDSYIRNNWTRSPNFTPNNMTGIVQGDGRTIAQIQPTARCVPAGPIFGYRATDADIYGPGIGGAHFGSGLSSIGGAVRLGELIGHGPVRHALQIDINMARNASYATPFRWPADRADYYHFNGVGYCSEDPCKSNPAAYALVGQGTLFALPPSATPASLGLKTAIGEKLFYALQNYGAYLVDDTGWYFTSIGAEYGVADEVEQRYGIDLFASSSSSGPSKDWYDDWSAMLGALEVISNNGPNNIGGGGSPRVAPAPAFVGPIPPAPLKLDRNGWNVVSATHDSANRNNILDGNPATVWRTGVEQAPGHGFVVDLGAARTFNRVALDGTANGPEYPQGYAAYVSNDGVNWGTPLHKGTGSGTDLTLATFPVQSARYLKIELYGGHIAHVPWTLGELDLYLVEALVGSSPVAPTATPTTRPIVECVPLTVNNGGFENGLDGWFSINPVASLTNDAYSGSSALLITGGEGGAGQSIAVTPGRQFKASLYAKRTDGSVYNGVGVNWADANFVQIAGGPSFAVNSDSYQPFVLSADVPAGAAYASLYFYKTGTNGSMFIDDVRAESCISYIPTSTPAPTSTPTSVPAPTSTPTSTPQPRSVRPVLECVAQQGNEYRAYFGYQNDSSVSVHIPVGPRNKFTPAPQDRAQPTLFAPGRQQRVFSVVFSGANLVWSLDGRTSTASRNSKRCAP